MRLNIKTRLFKIKRNKQAMGAKCIFNGLHPTYKKGQCGATSGYSIVICMTCKGACYLYERVNSKGKLVPLDNPEPCTECRGSGVLVIKG